MRSNPREKFRKRIVASFRRVDKKGISPCRPDRLWTEPPPLAETMLSNETDRSKVLWDTRSNCSASAPDRNLSAPRAQRVAATRAANAFIAASGIDFAAISLRRPKRRN